MIIKVLSIFLMRRQPCGHVLALARVSFCSARYAVDLILRAAKAHPQPHAMFPRAPMRACVLGVGAIVIAAASIHVVAVVFRDRNSRTGKGTGSIFANVSAGSRNRDIYENLIWVLCNDVFGRNETNAARLAV